MASDDESSVSDDGLPREAMLERKACFAALWDDKRLADVTIKVKIMPPAIEPQEPQHGQGEEKEEQPTAKRARLEEGDELQGQQQQEQQEQDAGVVAKMCAHGLWSEELQPKSENYAFSLALWWTIEQDGDDKELQSMFNRLLKSLRYARMSAVFLTSIAHLKAVKDSGLLPSIMTLAICRRDDVPRIDRPQMPRSRIEKADWDSYSLTFTTHFTKAAIEALQEEGDRAKAPLGLLHGFPCRLDLTVVEGGELGLLLFSDTSP